MNKPTTIPQERLDHINERYWSPQERAEGVHQIIMETLEAHAESHEEKDHPSFWDLMCWAVEFVSQQSIVIGDERFKAICVQLNQQLWSMHYNNAEGIYPREDKYEDTAIFDDRRSREDEEA